MNNWCVCWFFMHPLNAELNPICHLLALLGGATIVVVSRLRVKRIKILARTYCNVQSVTWSSLATFQYTTYLALAGTGL